MAGSCAYTEGVPHHKTTTMNNINPIELALAVILASVDSLLWVVNELLGLHASEVALASAQTALEEPTTAPSPSSCPILHTYTKRQLQLLTGVKSSRYNKQALLELAMMTM